MKYIHYISVYLLLWICSLAVHSQPVIQYPVQVFTQAIQHTPYVPQYYTGTFPKLRVTINNLDFQHPVLPVVVRMKIQSSSFSLYTPDYLRVFFTTLNAGTPLQLSGEDLAVFFRQENFQCSNKASFLRSQQLPDGTYSFHFEVYDAYTGRLLSNPVMGRAIVYIRLGEPPVLNFPEKEKIIQQTTIPNIMFSWRPALNVPSGFGGLEYEFSMVELYDKKTNPEGAFQYSRPLYTETVRTPSFIHGIAQPELIPGMRYAWRVRAVTRDGIDEVNVIKNSGYSPVFWFDYAADCNTVQTFGAIYENGHVNITWQDVNVMEYSVEYRKKNSSKWYNGSIVQPGLCSVYNLKFGEEYEYRIGTRCIANDAFQYSGIKAIRIPDREERGPKCGLMPDIKVSNKVPAQQLQSGLPIMVGDFPVFVTKVSGSGRFTGEGYVGIPYLSNLQVAVTFKDIVVNTDNRLISGFIETKYDPVNNMLVDVDKKLTGGEGVGDIRTGEEKAAYKVDYNINPNIKAKPFVSYDAKVNITESGDYILTKGENGKYTFVLMDSEGNEHKVETDTIPTTIEDKSGNTFEINEKGEVKPLSSKSNIQLDPKTRNTPHPEIATLSFEATGNTKYSVDSYKEIYANVTEFFLKYKPKNEDMIASAKFMVPGASDEIFVKVETSSEKFNPDKVHFVTDKGKEYKGTYDATGKGWTLNVVGSSADDGQNLYIVQDSLGQYLTLARLNIYSYEPKNLVIRLVPVNNFTNNFNEQELTKQLNTIYNKVGINCEIILDESFDYAPMQDKTFKTSGSGLFSKLTDDMKALSNAYKEAYPNPAEDACLFILNNVTSDDGVKGEMPRDEHFGYLFSGATAQTIAHEIGHGIFHLDHPFARANASKSFASGDLKGNVMEYPPHDGQEFVKLQWDAVHAPGVVIGLFEKDKGGMIKSDIKTILSQIVETLKAVGENGCAFVRKQSSLSYNTELNNSVTTTSIDYLVGKYENEQPSFNISLSSGKIVEITLGIQLMMENNHKNWVLHVMKGNVEICEAKEDYSSFVSLSEARNDTAFLNRYKADLLKCMASGGRNRLTQTKDAIRNKLDNQFYNKNGVKLCVTLQTKQGDKETLLSPGIDKCEDAEIFLIIDVNIETEEIKANINCAENYLREYIEKWQQEAGRQGLSVNVEELRKQVIADLESKETAVSFLEQLNQGLQSLLSDNVANFVEGVQVSQKIAKNVWAEGEINRSTWHTAGDNASEHQKWPKYAQFYPVVGGVSDGVIGEIVGIPVAIKGIYGVMTDAQQREAFSQLFTSQGISQMVSSLKEEAKATFSDGERLTHFSSRTVVEVASAVSGFSIISGSKVGDVLSGTGESLKNFLNPKLAGKIDDLMNQSKYLPDIKNAMKDFFKEMDPKLLDKLANIDNFDEVVKEMAQGWKKFHGEKFVFENIEKQGDEFVKGIKKFEAVFEDGTNYTADILLESGKRLEYKSWKKNTFDRLMKGDQFKNQLKNYIHNGNFEYIFDKSKLLKDGILDPDKFVRGEFQKVFRDNAKELFEQNQSFFQGLKIANENILENMAKNDQLINHQLFNLIIKVE